MSTEYEASSSAARRKDMQNATKNDSNDDDDNLEDLAGSANTSIIGNIKSRVSSIIPSSLSKWFSPSARNNDSLNGSFSIGTARRRRRLEMDDDDEYVDDGDTNEDGAHTLSEYKENLASHSVNVNKDSDEEDTDNNSEDELSNEPIVSGQSTHRTMNTLSSVNQPPSKRTRISFDVTSLHHQPLVASTPAVGISHRNVISHSLSIEDTMPKLSTSHSIRDFRASACNQGYMGQEASKGRFLSAPGSDINTLDNFSKRKNNEKPFDTYTTVSSRRTLHLPSTSQAANERAASLDFGCLKRQTLSGSIRDINKQNAGNTVVNTSSNIIEVETYGSDEEEVQIISDKQAEVPSDAKSCRSLNGNALSYVGGKKARLNGTDEAEESIADADSASESSEVCIGNIAELPNNTTLGQRKAGLFNMSNFNCQNGNNSRASSFGNGLNFYSHLEGRKSLFSGGTHIGESANALNNSTLSLTSLNRRQFNASIYGSTSALSDSRLLNTFSPFYKGKTTYGGAAAYKKYSTAAGASRMCNITPTIIRPTSSLSTLSSSNNSLTANTGVANALSGLGSGGTENTSAISSTAKRILDLINDFATPLSEAKKMANTSVKASPQILPQSKSRLNETDLQASRGIRLSQVRTPYMRPAVTLQPTIRNIALAPPVRELQVPSMSQILQMKKLQNTTERSRQIAMQNSGSTTRSIVGSGEYVLPIVDDESSVANNEDSRARHQQQQHTNKIKSKVRASVRITSKNAAHLGDDESPPPVNLPNIAFPLMQSVPKFDIALPKPQTVTQTITIKPDLPKLDNFTKSKSAIDDSLTAGSSKSNSVFTDKSTFSFSAGSTKILIAERSNDTANVNSMEKDKSTVSSDANINFKFSAPITFACTTGNVSPLQTSVIKKYTFSPPTAVCVVDLVSSDLSPTQNRVQSGDTVAPKLKSGSVLDAFKKPFTMPPTPKDTTQNSKDTGVSSGFGDQFKKAASNKWECGTCLIRNENAADKCVACETPRTTTTSTPLPIAKAALTTLATGTFGAQFKKSSDEWECGACMLRNKEQVDKCVACETARKGSTAPTSSLAPNFGSSKSWQPNSFGDAFKSKPNTWECPTCLINNKSDCSECVACQTKNPNGSSSDSSSACSTANNRGATFKFGFTAADSAASAQITGLPDTGFKTLAAAQMSAKWECDACMTRNDAARNKCVCCEQAKSGTTTPDVPSNGPKFTFGTAASSKFNFGFGANAKGTSTTGSGVVTTTMMESNRKTDGGSTKGFVFGNTSPATSLPGGGFSFGIPPATAATKTDDASKGSERKDVADSKSSTTAITETNTGGFKFGTSTTTASQGLVTTKATDNFNLGTTPNTGIATKAPTTASPTVKFSLATATSTSGAAAKDVLTSSIVGTTMAISKPTTGGFTFGNSITNATSLPSNSGFSFGTPTKLTAAEKSTQSTTTTTAIPFSTQPGRDVSDTTSSTTTSTATVKPMFSFGSSTTSTMPASTSTTTSSTTASAFSSPTSGFSFGSSIKTSTTTSPAAKPVFGSFMAPIPDTEAAQTVPSAPAPTNVFGTFGGNTSSARTTTTSATPTLASTDASSTTHTNLFGTISQGFASTANGESKPIASATMIFGSSGNATTTSAKPAAAAQATSTSFAFGSSTSNATAPMSNTASPANVVAAATNWPKDGFAFGASTVSAGTSTTNDTLKPVFGSFATPAAASPAMSANASVFGSLGAGNAASGASTTFGSVAANAPAVTPASIFGAGTSTTPTVPTSNLFGNVSATPSAFGAPAAFGSSSNNAASNAPTFGATSSATFGGFGSASASSSGDGAPAPKKSEPAFNFGGSSSQIGSGGGFNFGTPASAPTKPAFNFSASSVPTFNFTGSGSDATPNAPFQFNAGSAPASSNIFAPTPTAQNAPGPMQARRKIRQPTRRLTPR